MYYSFLTIEDFLLIKKLIDIILPKTDSPSATEAGVHKIIDAMVGTVYKPLDRSNYKKDFLALKKYLNSNGKDSFKVLQNLSESSDKNNIPAKKAFLNLRQQTIAYYLSTEEIGKNYLNYLPVPGEYEPCISLEEAGGKLWAE